MSAIVIDLFSRQPIVDLRRIPRGECSEDFETAIFLMRMIFDCTSDKQIADLLLLKCCKGEISPAEAEIVIKYLGIQSVI